MINEMAHYTTTTSVCLSCGSQIPSSKRGKARKYCGETCREDVRKNDRARAQQFAQGSVGQERAGGLSDARTDPPVADMPLGDITAGQKTGEPSSRYHAKFAAPAGHSVEDGSRRKARETLRDLLNEVSKVERCRKCGRELLGGAAVVKRSETKGSFFSGVETCGRVWLCPVCAAKIRNRRGDEAAEGVGRWIGQGHDAHFFTATLPHDQGDALKDSFTVLTDSWRWLSGHKRYRKYKERLGVAGYIKATEVNHGRNGWHPHLHLVSLLEQPISDSLVLFDWYYNLDDLWADALVTHGWSPGKAPYRFRALPVTFADKGQALAAYVTKVQDAGLGNELARADLKKGRKSSRTPFQILADFGEYGRADDLELWWEFEQATKGRSAIRWSPGLRKLLLPDVKQQTDEEIAAEEHEGDDIAYILPNTWYKICNIPGARVAVKEAVEQEGWEGLIRVLIAYRVGTEGVLTPGQWANYLATD